ncbi:MAG: HEAT repeat domain-containing protein [Nitrospira sp.]|nr:HEAT repeat domain-containing protein [Nitrospira sp.]
MKKILDKYNFAFVYSAKDTNNLDSYSSRIKEAWIFSDGKKGGGAPLREISARQEIYGYHPPEAISDKPDVTGLEQNLKLRGLQVVDTQDPTNIPALLNLLKDPNQSVRLAAMDTLSNFGPLIPVDQLVKIAFNNEDPQIRIAVLGMGIDIPNEAIVEHALHDPSPQVRLEALQMLGGSEDVEEVARHALNDNDPSVQDVAREILRGLSEENSGLPREETDGIQMFEGPQEGE